MKIAIYGLPCAGKTTLMKQIEGAKLVFGSEELQRISGKPFSQLTEDEKHDVRIKYTEYVSGITDQLIISDGHYSFLDNVVFTKEDGDLYDIIIYVYCNPSTLKDRFAASEKNQKYAQCPVNIIADWQNFEIERLRKECHRRNKDFYVVSDNDNGNCKFNDFLLKIQNGFSSYGHAIHIANQIEEIYPDKGEIYLVDGDKTIITQDSFKQLLNGKTKVFDGNFYTGYQSFLFTNELNHTNIPTEIDHSQLTINDQVWSMIGNSRYVVLSSGIKKLWDEIGIQKNFTYIFASTEISADTKYYVAKQLKADGYFVKAIGDSKNDLYMLQEADNGILTISEHISRSLENVPIGNIHLLYDKQPFILDNENSDEVTDNIAICKSNSGINGNRLAMAHFKLGQFIGNNIHQKYPSTDTAVLVLERGGRFFGDGLYTTFGGNLYVINPSKDSLPSIKEQRIVLVDSVINTGKSIMKIIKELQQINSEIDIVIAANVVQEKALEIFVDYKIFTVRVSKNSYIGSNQSHQTNQKGPDTAERIFNSIDKIFII